MLQRMTEAAGERNLTTLDVYLKGNWLCVKGIKKSKEHKTSRCWFSPESVAEPRRQTKGSFILIPTTKNLLGEEQTAM